MTMPMRIALEIILSGVPLLLWVHLSPRGFLRFSYAAGWFVMVVAPFAIPWVVESRLDGLRLPYEVEAIMDLVVVCLVAFFEFIAIQAVITAKLFLWSGAQRAISPTDTLRRILDDLRWRATR